jgi:hypothetical protein
MPVVGDAFLWTTTDGREWRGGRLADGVGTSTDVDVAAAGDVLIAGVATGGRIDRASPYELHRSVDAGASWAPATVPADLAVAPGGFMRLLDVWEADSVLVADVGQPVLASDDGGATWRYGACPDEAATVDGRCVRPEVHGELWVRDREVSLDAGRTWQEPVVDVDLSDPLMFGSVVELPDGGWVATGSTDDTDDEDQGYVLRSRDGLRWEELRPGACEGGLQSSGFTGLVPFGDGWLTAGRCDDGDDRVRSEVYAVGPDANRLEAVPDTLREDRSYSSATVVAGDVVLLVENPDGPSEILRISP